MGDNDSSLVSWEVATRACLKYLAKAVGLKPGKSAFVGTELIDDSVNYMKFILSGGPEQVQNFQCPQPGSRYVCEGFLVSQHESDVDAFQFAGKIQNALPPSINDDSVGVTPKRGIAPNVQLLEIVPHPSIVERTIPLSATEDKTVWNVAYQFRCVYDNRVS